MDERIKREIKEEGDVCIIRNTGDGYTAEVLTGEYPCLGEGATVEKAMAALAQNIEPEPGIPMGLAVGFFRGMVASGEDPDLAALVVDNAMGYDEVVVI